MSVFPHLLLALTLATLAAARAEPPQDRLAPEVAQGLGMRKGWGLAIPSCDAAVYVDSVGVHHVRTEQSTIACRDQAGTWTVTQVLEDGPGGLLPIEKRITRQSDNRLAPAVGRELDLLLDQPALYDEAVQRTGEIGVGAPFHTMQIEAPGGHVIARWNGRLLGRLGQVADIILGRD
ncbi:hypothetical protein [Azospirillum sp. B4]|uniref:hypothetical protein n=1 Tax=Azospirillum sp. B4 TaxID=95605 RepID=UPI0005C9454C|nr:hypothetical protein [Azospirillum sp. B4]